MDLGIDNDDSDADHIHILRDTGNTANLVEMPPKASDPKSCHPIASLLRPSERVLVSLTCRLRPPSSPSPSQSGSVDEGQSVKPRPKAVDAEAVVVASQEDRLAAGYVGAGHSALALRQVHAL